MTTRAVYRFVTWRLGLDPSANGPTYLTRCEACAAESRPAETRDETEMWSLRHAGLTGHTAFLNNMTYFSRATPVEAPG